MGIKVRWNAFYGLPGFELKGVAADARQACGIHVSWRRCPTAATAGSEHHR
jgi:hypothetical protein